jgi:aspartyl-tRNA(Asn)/glutamyl-tRNA(Gln) amidotransferase subunit C
MSRPLRFCALRRVKFRAPPCGTPRARLNASLDKDGGPMSIDVETARRVAKLARIRVEEADLPALAGEFNTILGFIEQLNEVDVTGIEPMTSVTPMRLRRRQDGVTDGGMQAKILSNAPDAREGFFAVPKVVE